MRVPDRNTSVYKENHSPDGFGLIGNLIVFAAMVIGVFLSLGILLIGVLFLGSDLVAGSVLSGFGLLVLFCCLKTGECVYMRI